MENRDICGPSELPKSEAHSSAESSLVRFGFRAVLVTGVLYSMAFPPLGRWAVLYGAALTLVAFPASLVFIVFLLMTIRSLESSANHQIIFGSFEAQQELRDDFANTLARLHLRWVGEYYGETRSQAKKSFYVAVAAAMVAFATIVAGIVLAYLGKSNAGILTASAGVAEGFISAVFFWLYSGTVAKMTDYHQRLILTLNVSLALKAAEDLPEVERIKVKPSIIKALIKDMSKS